MGYYWIGKNNSKLQKIKIGEIEQFPDLAYSIHSVYFSLTYHLITGINRVARTNIDLPESFVFTTQIDVRIDDINYGGHLGHDSVITLTHEARVRFFNKNGFSEKDIDGLGIIISDLAAVYKSETFYGDQLTVKIGIGKISKHSCEILYLLENSLKNAEVARVKTGIVFYDYRNRRVARVPVSFLQAVNET